MIPLSNAGGYNVTLLVEKLIESSELRALYEALPGRAERESLDKRRLDCERIVQRLMDRFASLNRRYSPVESEGRFASETAAASVEGEVSELDDAALLRYGQVLKYVCCAEAEPQVMPLEECEAKLRVAQAEWRRRFGNTILRDSV
jgi:hypothetical protein